MPRAPAPEPLCQAYDAALLDLDGVVYLGGKAIPGAAEALGQAAARRHAAGLRDQQRLALPVRHRRPDQRPGRGRGRAATSSPPRRPRPGCWPSGCRPGRAVLVVGGNALRIALRERGLRPVSVAAEHPLAVVQGYTPDLSYGLLTEAALALRAGRRFVATNVDPTLPTPRGLQPGNGSLIAAAGHRDRAAARGGRASPSRRCTPRRCSAPGRPGPLVVGDRLDTDIEGGGPQRGRQPAGADRGQLAGRRGAGPAVAAAHLPGPRPGRPADQPAGGEPGRGRRLRLRRLDGPADGGRGQAGAVWFGGLRWTGCASCARRPGRAPGSARKRRPVRCRGSTSDGFC